MASFMHLMSAAGTAVKQHNGGAFGEALSLGKKSFAERQEILSVAPTTMQFRKIVQDNIPRVYYQIVSSHITSWYCSENNQPFDAYTHAQKAAEAFFTQMLADKNTNWWLPAINAVLLQLRLSSYRADLMLERNGEKTKYIMDAQSILVRYYRNMIQDRSAVAVSKKMGCLFVIVHLFKIYFKLNNLRLCNNLVNSVNNASFPQFSSFPKSQTVSYNYYLGRLMVFEEQYDRAEECLDYSFKHCHRDHLANKSRILQFLIPVKLLLGKFPQERLLQKYDLPQFVGLIEAIKQGNLGQFNSNLEKHTTFFINKGIFLILEKLKTFVYRNLFRKINKYNLTHQPSYAKKNQLQLNTLQAALRVNGTDMELNELECILANLIFQGSIKGYIAHKRCVVLSKTDPFPQKSR